MKSKIFKEVYQGGGAIHLLSVVEKDTIDLQMPNIRNSHFLKTKKLVLDPFYKSVV